MGDLIVEWKQKKSHQFGIQKKFLIKNNKIKRVRIIVKKQIKSMTKSSKS